MDIILKITNEVGMEILGTILTALAAVLAMAIKQLATKYINTEVKQRIARTVVQGVEQLYKDLHGDEKLDKALEAAAEMLTQAGITVTELELRMLIEAAVGEFNEVFKKPLVLEGIAVEDLTDDQLRSLLDQMGYTCTEDMTREEMLAELDAMTAEKPQA